MSFYYTEFIKSKVIEMLEEGIYSYKEIADSCHVSPEFIRAVANAYDMFYVGRL